MADLRLTRDDIAAAHRRHRRVLAEIRRRMELYGVPPLSWYLPGRSVVLVDDGPATGLTMQAAVGYARRHGARDITIAVPCASARAVGRFHERVERLVSLVTDAGFRAVGQYYRAFPAVADEDVRTMLAQAAQWAAERLLVVGEQDETAHQRAEALAARLVGPRRIEVIKGVNASFDDPMALDHAANATVRWVEQHLGAQG